MQKTGGPSEVEVQVQVKGRQEEASREEPWSEWSVGA